MTYDEFINDKVNSRGYNTKPNDGLYYEKHHIIPKASPWFGSNSANNLVYLTFTEHIEAHRLFWEETKHPKAAFALHMLVTATTKNMQRTDNISSDVLEEARKAHSEAASAAMKERWEDEKYRSAHSGFRLSDEVRDKISKNHPDFSGENNPNYGKIRSDESKEKSRQSNIETWSDIELRRRHSEIKKGQGCNIHYCPQLDMSFNGAKEAAMFIGIKKWQHIYDVEHGRRKSCGKHPDTGEPLTWVILENK